MKRIFSLFLTCCALAAGSVHANIIDFQNLPSGSCAALGGSPVASGGFMFGGNAANPSLYSCQAGVAAGNTSDALLNANGPSAYTMTQWGGTAFSLNFFEAGSLFQQPLFATSSGVQVMGWVADGDPVSQSFYFDGNAFGLFLLNAQFTNLIAVTFTSIGSGNAQFMLDNIGVNGATPVPEPGTILLSAIGVLLLLLARRKKLRD